MGKFMIAYYGGNQPSSKEEGMAQMVKWKAWVEGLGEKIINPGTPLPVSKLSHCVALKMIMIQMR